MENIEGVRLLDLADGDIEFIIAITRIWPAN